VKKKDNMAFQGLHDFAALFNNQVPSACFKRLGSTSTFDSANTFVKDILDWKAFEVDKNICDEHNMIRMRLFLNMISPIGIAPMTGNKTIFLAHKIFSGILPGTFKNYDNDDSDDEDILDMVPAKSPLFTNLQVTAVVPRPIPQDWLPVLKDINVTHATVPNEEDDTDAATAPTVAPDTNQLKESWKNWFRTIYDNLDKTLEIMTLDSFLSLPVYAKQDKTRAPDSYEEQCKLVTRFLANEMLSNEPTASIFNKIKKFDKETYINSILSSNNIAYKARIWKLVSTKFISSHSKMILLLRYLFSITSCQK
jgi:hypothetical protein